MHCSANINQYNDTALFFGLSGTGKTTLSTDVSKNIIGDDEHGWDDDGIFNFEGGCYAKTNGLSQKSEPLIYNAIKTNALLENVVMDESMVPNYNDISKTENGRVSYPLSHIPNRVITSKGSHPKNIIFLTCDRYGVLPSVAKLTKEQAIYYFLSGYTSKVSGTERGVTEPEATFSPCFGGAFLTLPPEKYGSILYQKLQKHNCNVYLVNTGWSGTGKRFSIEKTRKIIHDIMSGDIAKNVFETDPIFHFTHPISENPKNSWKDKREFERKRWNLARMFRENFEKNNYSTDLQKYGP
jgi:phosphoenolpyruvate carboxykinase (ATP)